MMTMRTIRPPTALALFALAVPACSFMLSFDEKNRPCGPDDDNDGRGDCLEGYSCMVNVCVKDHSVPEGETCSSNVHCVQGTVCRASFVCHKRCAFAFGEQECGDHRACAVITDVDGHPALACVKSECDAPGSCIDTSLLCVKLKADVGLCMDGCSVSCTSGECLGNCPLSSEAEARACQPVGPDRTLACVLRGDRDHGRSCNFVDELCDNSHACVTTADGKKGLCLKYCETSNDCVDAENNPLDDPSTTEVVDAAKCIKATEDSSFAVCGALPPTPGPDDGADGGGDADDGVDGGGDADDGADGGGDADDGVDGGGDANDDTDGGQ